jgi:hypothetical protein
MTASTGNHGAWSLRRESAEGRQRIWAFKPVQIGPPARGGALCCLAGIEHSLYQGERLIDTFRPPRASAGKVFTSPAD